MNVILSIKPKYVKNILSGKKKYEFRKQVPKSSIETVYIYSSAPEKKIVGYFNINKIISDTPKNLWSKLEKKAGITKEEFFEYYEGKEVGYAYSINELNVFQKPIDPYLHIENFIPPQSFHYLNGSFEGKSSKKKARPSR